MTNRTLRFELHIRPLFSAMDRAHMMPFFDLWDTSTFYSDDGKPKLNLIQNIYKHIAPQSGLPPSMPPQHHGGPWPDEWQKLYKRWMDEGCQKLQLGQGDLYAERNGNVFLYADEIIMPVKGQVWLQKSSGNTLDFTYHLYIEAPDPSDGKTVSKSITEEIVNVPQDVKSLTVITQKGSEQVKIN